MRHLCSVALFGLALIATPALAQAPAPGPPASKDATVAAAGAYKLDPTHASVIARIGHGNGFSYSTFRFNTVSGSLAWDPAQIENSKLEVTIDIRSIANPVPGFVEELQRENFLNTGAYPEARFVSTSIRRTSPTKGQISGNLTFRGQTKPVTIDGELIGAGSNFRGVTTLGFSGATKFKRSDFGYGSGVPIIADEVELLIDVEFNKL